MKTTLKYSGSIIEDVSIIRGMETYEIYPGGINYKIPNAEHMIDFLAWNKEFVVFCDCDTDGLCAAAICKLYFDRNCDNVIHYKVASRDKRGFTQQDVEDCIREYPNATGIMSVDCGMGGVDAVEYGKLHGIDIFITDHHNPSINTPDTFIINPKLDDRNVFKDFCGAGLVYLIMKQNFGDLHGAIQYAAIATVADMVPLLSDNRYIVQTGIKQLRNPNKKHPNINTLFSGMGAFVLNEKDIGWGVAPVINSASRLGKESVALKAVVFADADAAKELVAINEKRKSLIDELYELGLQTVQISNNGASIFLGESESNGVLGLVAMKLSTKFGMPAITACVNDEHYFFSMRATRTSDFIDYLKQHADFEVIGGGHDAAGGFSTYNKLDEVLKEFHEFYDMIWNDGLSEVHSGVYDIEISLEDAIQSLTDKDTLRPFGMNFEEPIYVSRGVIVKSDGTTRNKKSNRFKAFDSQNSEQFAIIVDFNNQISEEGKFDIAYKLSYNTYMKGPQIDIIDIYRIE